MTRVGIVILNYKTYNDTIRLVHDLLSFKMKKELQIMVVDNLSPNESFEVLKRELGDSENVDVIQSGENGGYAKGNNVGLRTLKKYNPDYALILNNDVYFSEKTLQNCIDLYAKLPDIGQLSPLQQLPDGKIAKLGTLKCNNFLQDVLCHFWIYSKFCKGNISYTSNTSVNNLRKVDIIPGCFVFINYKLFESVGFYDEDTFLFCEERLLYKKLKNNGYNNYLITDDGYIHDHSLTIRNEVDSIRQRKYINDGQIAFTKKYRSFPLIKSILLKTAFKLSVLELYIIFFIRRFKS